MQARVNPNERANQTLTPPDPSKTYFRLVPKGEAPPRVGQWVENALPYEGSSAATGFVTFDIARHWSSGASAFVVECEGDGMAVYRGLGEWAHTGRMASSYDEVPTGLIYPRTRAVRAATEAELNERGVYTTGRHRPNTDKIKAIAVDGTAGVSSYGGLESALVCGDAGVWVRDCKVLAHDHAEVRASGGSVTASDHAVVFCSEGTIVQATGKCRVVGSGIVSIQNEVWAHISDGVLYIKDAFSGPRTSGAYTRSDRAVIVDQRSGGNVAYGQCDGLDGWRFDPQKTGDKRWFRATELVAVPNSSAGVEKNSKVNAAVEAPATIAAPTAALDDIVNLVVELREAEAKVSNIRARLTEMIAGKTAATKADESVPTTTPAPTITEDVAGRSANEIIRCKPRKTRVSFPAVVPKTSVR